MAPYFYLEIRRISPWPEHEADDVSPAYSRYPSTQQNQWASFEWSNRNGKSRIHRELPKDEQYPINIFGHTPVSDRCLFDSTGAYLIEQEQAFTDFPRPKDDLSSGEDDFAAHFPDPRQRPSHAVSNERHTQRQAALLNHPESVAYSLRPPPSGAFQQYDDYAYEGPSSSHGDHNEAAIQRLPAPAYLDDDSAQRRGKQLFDETGYFATPGIPSPLTNLSGDMSPKAKGKQRSYDHTEEGLVPNIQMSGLRLGMDNGPLDGQFRSRSFNSESINDDDEYIDARHSRNPISTGRSGRIRNATSRSGKRPVTSDEEDESALDQSLDALPVTAAPKPTGKKRKVNRYECPVPLCKETFTRRNDVRRHIKNAAIHRDSPEALALLGEAVGTGTRCKFCNADLSRSDARMRHERASACGKRTTQKMKDQMLLMRA